jgi:WD40 repeat protein
MDLNYGKSKMVSAIDWMPGKRGIVAAAVSASSSFDERVQVAGRPCSSHVLLWTFQDPIHPWMVLESSSDIFSLRFNPVKPHLIAGGCYNGQVILWDITKAQEKQDRKDRREAEESSEDKEKKKSVTMTPVVLFTLLSTMKTSHKAIVSDIHWLPKDFQV